MNRWSLLNQSSLWLISCLCYSWREKGLVGDGKYCRMNRLIIQTNIRMEVNEPFSVYSNEVLLAITATGIKTLFLCSRRHLHVCIQSMRGQIIYSFCPAVTAKQHLRFYGLFGIRKQEKERKKEDTHDSHFNFHVRNWWVCFRSHRATLRPSFDP